MTSINFEIEKTLSETVGKKCPKQPFRAINHSGATDTDTVYKSPYIWTHSQKEKGN